MSRFKQSLSFWVFLLTLTGISYGQSPSQTPEIGPVRSAGSIKPILGEGATISPDGDGFYETLHFEGLSAVSRYNIQITNQAHRIMFRSTDKTEEWAGIDPKNGRLAAKGSYLYVIKADNEIIRGRFTLAY